MNSKLTDPATLKRAFPVVVAAYRDYQHYYCTNEQESNFRRLTTIIKIKLSDTTAIFWHKSVLAWIAT